jgi:peptide-methionine (S)-S-oxide reductase
MGGWLKSPTYRQVCTDQTGHAEVVQVEYDPTVVSYEQLLELFWEIHDPTTVNRQGPDVGTQYRSVIFHHDARQKAAAQASLKRLDESGELSGPVVTQIVPASVFYRAEEYHQRYYERTGIAPHCGIRRPRMVAD